MKIEKLLNFKDCVKCRQCCKFKNGEARWAPVFSRAEIETIGKTYKGKASWRKYRNSQNSFQPRLKKAKEQAGLYVCPFLNEQKYTCLIERVKPFDCRIWPFVLMKNKKKDAINLVYYSRKYCPGLSGVGQRRFENYKKYLVNFCKLNSIVPFLGALWEHDTDATRICEIMKLPKGMNF